MSSSFSDQELLISLKNGDHGVFSIIYDQYAASLMDYAAVRVDTFEDANDIIHDLFVQLWENRDKLEIKYSFKAFLYFCLKRRILDYYRKNKTRQAYADQLQILAQSFIDAPDSELHAKELADIVQKIIAEMPSRMREIYLLSREQHLSIGEIASNLNISEQTVKNQLYRATSILRSKFNHTGILVLLLVDLFISRR